MFSGIPISEFVDIILSGNKGDEAMYYLLHHRLNHQLREQYDVYNLYDDFEDIVEDYFLYLREGKEGKNRHPYQSLRHIKKKESFETWLINTFRNYLSNRSEAEKHVSYTELDDRTTSQEQISPKNDEEKLAIASQLIAYAHQVLYPRSRFIFLRSLLTMLNKQRAISDKEMAEALGMTHIAYRVTVHRMKHNLTKFYKRLQHGEHLNLNEEHRQMACAINDDFTNLYPILFNYYMRCIDTLKTSIAVKNLRQQYLNERGFEVHEQDSFITHLSITTFWNKLNLQFLSL